MMQEIKIDVESRMDEINSYYNFLILVDKTRAEITYKDELTHEQINSLISVDLKKILIANTFLLMYNLLESCVSKVIAELYDHFNNKNITYPALDAIYKKLYLEENLANLKEGNFNFDTLTKTVNALISAAITNTPIKLSHNHKFSGNVDAEAIRNVAKIYNVKLSKSNGEKLVEIKTYRNKLAHGNLTFSAVGGSKSVNDILGYKDQLFPYLKKFIADVEDHINSNKTLVDYSV